MVTCSTDIPIKPNDAGLTLMEMLVMLVIASVVAAVSVESIRVASGNGIRVSKAAREATGELINRTALRSMIEGSRADYAGGEGQFRGEANHFSSTTSTPLSGRLGEPQTYSLSFETDASSRRLRLIYDDGHGEIMVGSWPDASGSFKYYVEETEELESALASRPGSVPRNRDRQWVDALPAELSSSGQYFSPLPLALKIEIEAQSKGSIGMIIRFPVTAPPPPREEDLFGAIGP